jgi:hypothetical protein
VRRLKTGQSVTLDVGGEQRGLACAVLSVDGTVATLAEVDRPAPELRARLSRGAMAYLVFGDDRAPIALKGVAFATEPAVDVPAGEETETPRPRASKSKPAKGKKNPGNNHAKGGPTELPPPPPEKPQELHFEVIDGVQIQQRRQFGRIPLITPVYASSPDGSCDRSEAAMTVTSNLGLGGAKLTRRPALGEGPRWRLELMLPTDPEPVRCNADLVRSTPTHVSVQFSGMSEADRARLAVVLAAWEHRAVEKAT